MKKILFFLGMYLLYLNAQSDNVPQHIWKKCEKELMQEHKIDFLKSFLASTDLETVHAAIDYWKERHYHWERKFKNMPESYEIFRETLHSLASLLTHSEEKIRWKVQKFIYDYIMLRYEFYTMPNKPIDFNKILEEITPAIVNAIQITNRNDLEGDEIYPYIMDLKNLLQLVKAILTCNPESTAFIDCLCSSLLYSSGKKPGKPLVEYIEYIYNDITSLLKKSGDKGIYALRDSFFQAHKAYMPCFAYDAILYTLSNSGPIGKKSLLYIVKNWPEEEIKLANKIYSYERINSNTLKKMALRLAGGK